MNDERAQAGKEGEESLVKFCVLCGTRYSGDTRFCPVDGQALRPEKSLDPLVGTLVAGRYLVERKIGQGGMGSVYLAEQVTIGRKVALKVLQPERSGFDPDAPLRFAREASNASRLTHQHVASIFDFGEVVESGLLYFAMEFVEGESLGSLIRREKPLSPRRAASIAWQIADAVAAAHELGVVHRDLKPDNVMLARRPDGADFVKVVDFGISRVMDSTTQALTSTGVAIGTPQYMSPEQLRAGAVDERADVFALGLVCYSMLTGELPWPSVPREQLLAQRFGMPKRSLAEICPQVSWPSELQLVLDAALALERDQRCQSISLFATDLLYAVQSWIPDDPGSAAPWDRRLRSGTPASAVRIPSDRVSAIRSDAEPRRENAGVHDRARGSESTLGDGSPKRTETLPRQLEHANADGDRAVELQENHLADARSRDGVGADAPKGRSALPNQSRTFGTMPRARVAWIAALGLTGIAAVALWRAGGARVSPMSSPTDAAGQIVEGTKPDSAPRYEPSTTPLVAAPPPKAMPTPNAVKGVTGADSSRRDSGRSVAKPSSPQPPISGRPDSGAGAVRRDSLATASDALTGSQVREMLDRLGAWTLADAPSDSALRALQLIPRMMPFLRTASDSVEAQVRAVEAHLRLDEPGPACRILLTLESRVQGTRFRRKVTDLLQSTDLNCRNR